MRLTTTNQALLVVGVLTFFLAVTTSVILAVAEAKTMKSKPCHYECSLLKYFSPGSWLSLVLLVVVGVLLVVCVALWIAVCAHVIPEDGTIIIT